MLKSLVRFISGMVGKLIVVGVVALCVLLIFRWYQDRPLKRFCDGSVVGMSRRAAAELAGKEGLQVSFGDNKDQVAAVSQSVGLSWCVLGHDGTKVTSTKFI